MNLWEVIAQFVGSLSLAHQAKMQAEASGRSCWNRKYKDPNAKWKGYTYP